MSEFGDQLDAELTAHRQSIQSIHGSFCLYVVVYGDLSSGFQIYGPFHEDDALTFIETRGGLHYTLMDLRDPKERN